MKRDLLVLTLLFLLLFSPGKTALAAMNEEEVLRRLDELSTIIQKQQEEIDRLRQELQRQRGSIQEAQEVREEEIEKTVAIQVEEKEKGWREWVPKWVRNTKVSGDLRLRYEGIYGRERQLSSGSWEDQDDRNRFRVRGRLFVDSTITDEFATYIMLTTDDDSVQDPTTSNQSFTDDFNNKGVFIGRAYATYTPRWLPGLELAAGKFKNTFLHTDIMWDPDVNPEGAYERYKYAGFGAFQPFAMLGQMVVNENNLADDATLFVYQLGFEWKIGPVKWVLAGSYYDWDDLEDTEFLHNAEYKSGGGNTFTMVGSELQYLYRYKLAEAISFISFDLKDYPLKILLDYIVNTDDDAPSDRNKAYYAGFLLGKEKEKGDWSLLYKYARIEKDAVIGSLNDQDFFGANRKGHKVALRYRLFDKVGVGAAFFYTDPVEDWFPAPSDAFVTTSPGHESRLQTEFLFVF